MAAWVVGETDVAVEDGTASVRVPVSDGVVLQGHVTFTLTAERDLRVVYEAEPGTPPLRGFSAWAMGGDA